MLSKEFEEIDFSALDELWPAKEGLYAFDHDSVLERGKQARRWLKARPEKVIAVVTHSRFLRTSVVSSRFANADYRIYDFNEKDESGDALLVQWVATESRGGGMGKSIKGPGIVKPKDFPSAKTEQASQGA